MFRRVPPCPTAVFAVLMLVFCSPASAAFADCRATLCYEHHFKLWKLMDCPDYGKAFEGVDWRKAAPGEGAFCGYHACYLLQRKGKCAMLVRMYKDLPGMFSLRRVEGILPNGQLILGKGEGRDVCLPELYDTLLQAELPEHYSPWHARKKGAARAKKES